MTKCLKCLVNPWVICTVCLKRYCVHHWGEQSKENGVRLHSKSKKLQDFGFCGKQKVGWRDPGYCEEGKSAILIPCKEWIPYTKVAK